MLATEVHRRLISDCNGRDPRFGAVLPLRRFGIALVPCLHQTAMGVTLALVPCSRYGVSASLWCRASRFWAVFPPRRRGSRRPVLAQTAAIPLSDADPPGSGLSCRKTGLNLTSFRGSGRLFRFLAAIRVDGCGITPGRKHSRRRCPVPQPTKPPKTLLEHSASKQVRQLCRPTKPSRTLLGYFADLRTLGIDCLTKPPRTLLGHFRSRISPSVELPTKPPRALLRRYVGPRTALKTA